MTNELGRRNFLKIAGLSAGAAGLAAVANRNLPSASAGSNFPQAAPLAQEEVDWREIDRLHRLQVETFVANVGTDPIFWRTPLEFTMSEDGYKVFNIVCQEVEWETEPGQVFPAMTYNGMVPGPEIRVQVGDKVRINVTNELAETTGIHFHGVHTPNSQDGIPFLTQPGIEPGATFTYEFDIVNSGSHMYHSHHNAAEQVIRGLLGAFIIEGPDEPEVAREYVMVLNDSGLGYTINGKSFPYTQPLTGRVGERVRIRFMNEGLMIHPMHLHGHPMTVFAKDGYPLPMPYMCDTLNIAPGERYDVYVDLVYPGAWAFHCHVLTHAESRRGLFGMTTVFIIEE